MHGYSNPSLDYCYHGKHKVLIQDKCKITVRNVPNVYILRNPITFFKLYDFLFGIYEFGKFTHNVKN